MLDLNIKDYKKCYLTIINTLELITDKVKLEQGKEKAKPYKVALNNLKSVNNKQPIKLTNEDIQLLKNKVVVSRLINRKYKTNINNFIDELKREIERR